MLFKKNKLELVGLFLLFPMFLYAHGEQVLLTLFLGFISFVIGCFITYKLPRYKAGVFAIFLLSIILVNQLLSNMPYLQNEKLINLIVSVVPILSILISFYTIDFIKKK